MSSLRYPAVAGAFYPGDRFRLKETVDELTRGEESARPAVAAVVPHAGYVYSGGCAGRTLGGVRIPRHILLLGPNHTGRGARLSAAEHEAWSTPLGSVGVARELLEAIAEGCPELVFDSQAHRSEHSLEVQLPFLQVLNPGCEIAPISVGTHDLGVLRALGQAIAAALGGRDDVLVVVSSDMTHYEPASRAREQDMAAIERLAEVDPEGLAQTVASRKISMCGVAPATAALFALREMGVARGELVCYTHSGEVTGDDREVVAYAGMVYRA